MVWSKEQLVDLLIDSRDMDIKPRLLDFETLRVNNSFISNTR